MVMLTSSHKPRTFAKYRFITGSKRRELAMRDFDTQEDASLDFDRLVHGIESNRKNLMEVASKAEVPREHLQGLQAVITAQEGLLNEMLRRNVGHQNSCR